MGAKRKVTPREYKRWVKWLKQQGYSGPFAGLTTKHEYIRLLAKELKKVPPTILETRPRDPRTIVSNLTRYGRRGGQPRPSKGKFETVHLYESLRNLPFWVVQAQQDHLEGKGQQDERGGIDIITYPGGIGIRQLLQRFQGCFLDIGPWSRSVWHPLDDHESMMIRLRCHLRDEAFWSQVKDFSEKARECEGLLDSSYERFTSAGKELAPLEPPTGWPSEKRCGPPPDTYITSGWARQVVVLALSPKLGLKRQQYHHGKLKDGDCLLISYDEYLYIGPDGEAAEQKHNNLVNDFIKTEEFSRIVNLMKELRDLRPRLIARIKQCLYDKEYVLYYCPSCPAEQALGLT